MLVLTGPPGAGKTATIRALAGELNLDVCEWLNPVHLPEWNFDGQGAPRD